MARLYGSNLSPRNKQALLDAFNGQKINLGPSQGRSVTLMCEHNDTACRVVLDPASIGRCFNEALEGPLKVAADRIAELSQIHGSVRKVVVSGGTSRTKSLKERLQALCYDAGLPEPMFTDDFDMYYE